MLDHSAAVISTEGRESPPRNLPLTDRRSSRPRRMTGMSSTKIGLRSLGILMSEEYLTHRLTKFFPPETRKRRSSVFSEGTWALYTQKMQCKKLITQCQKTHDEWLLLYGFQHLQQTDPLHARLQCLLIAMRTGHRRRQYKDRSAHLQEP